MAKRVMLCTDCNEITDWELGHDKTYYFCTVCGANHFTGDYVKIEEVEEEKDSYTEWCDNRDNERFYPHG